ncbi:MAG: glycosyltransferase family 2 protein, partial [Patescibacteria group bacterium]|nr:glycosyltransferase family 2 protein [Patescibacteria group bacterium]
MDLSLKSTKPKVSMGLPVYNGEEFLRKKLDSILSQT